MDEGFAQGKHLLDVAEVAAYLQVEQTTVQRWCREGSLPCMKIGKEWRIRHQALERFLERSERSESLVGRLRSFLKGLDNVLAITKRPRDYAPPGRRVLPGRRGPGWKANQVHRW